MAVVDDLGQPGMDSPPPSEDFGRQPPQDLAAEQSVLGGMLLSKDAIADVLERLRPGDFYRPAHQNVYDAILDLYGRGEPADAVTVAAELDRRGLLRRIGGAPYLHTLISTVPTAANAGYYAGIVAEKALLRRLVEAGTRVVQYGYAGAEGADVNEIVDRAQAEIYDVTERRTTEDFLPLEDLLQPTMDEIDAIASQGGVSRGVPTGFTELDELTNGLHPGQMIVVAARPGMGKALGLDTPLPTPTGWTTMGEVKVGDYLIDADGCPTRVVAATDVMVGRPCYEVEFSDGTVLIADAEHQWLTETRASMQTCAAVRTTRQIAATLRCPTQDHRLNHSVTNAKPLQAAYSDLPVPPYTLGAWLGGGIRDGDPEMMMRVEAEGADIDALDATHIAAEYLRASETQRRTLLAGLLDAAGIVKVGGAVQLRFTDRQLADDAFELIVSLGYRCHRAEGPTGCILNFSTDDSVFQIPRKVLAHKEQSAGRPVRVSSRFVTDVRPIASVPVRCVEVDNDAHLYLAGRAMIPTHNSTLGLDFMRSCSIKNRLPSIVFSLEMSKSEIVMRLLSAEAKIKLADMRSGRMTDDDWTRLARRMSEISEAPLYIDDSPNLTMMEIRAKARRLHQKAGLRLIVLDYLQLMTSGKKVESRQQEVSEFSRQIKLLAKELEVPVVAMSQLNRGPEQRTDKKPMLADLRESGSIEQDADMVILLHRPDAFETDDPRGGEADLIVAKHRAGPTRTVTVAHQLHLSRFTNMAR
ncbi:replicative DNA helicase [Mycobacterium crocinum]|uniref:replicative DNA helicase n=1 Tax=Mycolicibacterium crocinum TaxID=388459 RepID=UPI0023B8C447|nr:replicative DNA helicase [Mycolicibacterium crocinum]MCV7214775.1 replicative DNA helicase [Mycolicibacterium crocinum]